MLYIKFGNIPNLFSIDYRDYTDSKFQTYLEFIIEFDTSTNSSINFSVKKTYQNEKYPFSKT